MDLVSAAMSIYLLFPILNERQQNYSEMIKKNLTSSTEEIQKRLELVKFLDLKDSEYEDEEELLFNSEEEFLDETDSAEKKENIAEIYLRDTNNHLKHFEYGDEKFSIAAREELRSTVVSVNEDTVTRIKYDSSYRIIESIEWRKKNTVSESTMLTKKNWFYTENSIYMTEENFIEKTFTDTVFNLKELPIKVSVYNIAEKKSDDSEEKNQEKNLSVISYYDYDFNDSVILDKEEFYEQKINVSTGRIRNVIVYSSRKKICI